MAAASVPGLEPAPTDHQRLLGWVREVANLTAPEQVVWCDGSTLEWQRLTEQLVDAGTFVQLAAGKKPNSFWVTSDPPDVTRVEDRTFICSVHEDDAGPTNNWVRPDEMKQTLTALYRGAMRGRTMYVIPFCMGPTTAQNPKLGVQITDSAYVVASMHLMTRMGTRVLELFGDDADFVPCLHSLGAPLEPQQIDVPWPCSDTKYITHFSQERAIWTYGSGYGGNALLGKKCYSLRIASVMARDEGWLEIFYVNWFRRGDDGGFLWPGFGENSRAFKWAIARLEGAAPATLTAIGYVPTHDRSRPVWAGPIRRGHHRRTRRRYRRVASRTPAYRGLVHYSLGGKLPTVYCVMNSTIFAAGSANASQAGRIRPVTSVCSAGSAHAVRPPGGRRGVPGKTSRIVHLGR